MIEFSINFPFFFFFYLQSNDARNSPKEFFKENNSLSNNNNSNSRNFNLNASGSGKKDDRGSISDQAFQCSASSVESLPSASGSSTQALVRPGSPNSSLSADDRATIVPICKARAVVDCMPNPYDKEALRFKVTKLMKYNQTFWTIYQLPPFFY